MCQQGSKEQQTEHCYVLMAFGPDPAKDRSGRTTRGKTSAGATPLCHFEDDDT
jgi:hypothetical protein